MKKVFLILAIICGLVSFIAYCTDDGLSNEPIYLALLTLILGVFPSWWEDTF
jgi:hypothetical protein